MKKYFWFVFVIVIFAAMLCGCNYQMVDMTATYDYAIISMPDGTVEKVEVKRWKDYEGEQLQIEAEDGTIYLTNSFNCLLVKE